jgi:hypothetical protein
MATKLGEEVGQDAKELAAAKAKPKTSTMKKVVRTGAILAAVGLGAYAINKAMKGSAKGKGARRKSATSKPVAKAKRMVKAAIKSSGLKSKTKAVKRRVTGKSRAK